MSSPFYPSLFGYTNGVRKGMQLIVQICVLYIIRNNCSLTKPNTERPPLFGCKQLFNQHTHSHLPYPKPVSLLNPKNCHAVITRKTPKMNGVTLLVLHIRVYFSSKVNSKTRPNSFTVSRIAVKSYRRAGNKFVGTVKQSSNL
jgi:hypothetical protein